MRRRTRRAILRTAAASVGATAVALALVTAASTVYTFGVASHRLPAGGWNTHRPGSGAWGASADRGRLYVTLDATAGGVPGPRRLHAGAEASPGVSLDLGLSRDGPGRFGVDALRHDRFVVVGCFGLYPVLALAGLSWLLRRAGDAGPAEAIDGACPICGYDLRASPARCPECGFSPRRPPADAAPPAP